MQSSVVRLHMRRVILNVVPLLLGIAPLTALHADDAAQSSSASSSGKAASFFKKFADDVKAGVKAGTQGTAAAPAAASPTPAATRAKAELPELNDRTVFGKTAVAGLRIGMTEAEASKLIRQNSPQLVTTPYWMSVSGLSDTTLQGALGLPKPAKPDNNWTRGGPYFKTGLEFTPPGNFGGDCINGLRVGMPDTTAAQRNQTCERIWLQTTPDAADTAKVVAISRTLLFGGDAQPALETLINDLKTKYGQPSAVTAYLDTSKGKLPVIMVWEYDASGALKSTSQGMALTDRIAGWSEAPRPYTGGGWEGRINVIGDSGGPEFTRYVFVSNNPRQLTVMINQSATEPLLAGRLHVTLMDPGGVLMNQRLRIDAANKLIDEHNARINKAQQDAADRAAKNKPAL